MFTKILKKEKPYVFRLLERYGSEPSVYYISRQPWVRKRLDWVLEEEHKKYKKS